MIKLKSFFTLLNPNVSSIVPLNTKHPNTYKTKTCKIKSSFI